MALLSLFTIPIVVVLRIQGELQSLNTTTTNSPRFALRLQSFPSMLCVVSRNGVRQSDWASSKSLLQE